MQLNMKKGAVDHECEPACALHEMGAQPAEGASTGKEGRSGRQQISRAWVCPCHREGTHEATSISFAARRALWHVADTHPPPC